MPTRNQFLVARVVVRYSSHNRWFPDHLDRADDACRLVPVCVCSTREQAGDESRSREVKDRRFLNPFRRGPGSLNWLTSLSATEFRTRVQHLGVHVPPPDKATAMIEWWDEAVRPLSDEVYNAVWELLDKLEPLYQILEIELED
ncbi:MAG: hypothetical protein ABGY75_05495 [Gemmataceae bacterium]